MPIRVVVGAAIVRDGRLLAARRSSPAELAGGWEFPGGKVEGDESEPAALMRECREELGVEVMVGRLLATASLAPGWVLHVYLAAVRSGRPQALQDHDELRWLAADELDSVAWLAAEQPALAAVAALLTG
ncbi:MAG: (deoxy)nucleoside triphosphate pyrophosphohydrolase [Jatrophihabitantaceae bacterium]